MNDTKRSNEKTAPDVASIESGVERQRAPKYIYNDTTKELRCQGFIESALKQGAENAINARELTTLLGLSDTRHTARIVQAEREAGAVILSATKPPYNGYYLPGEGEKGRQEIAEFVCSMESRIANIKRSTLSAIAALKEVEGQLEIEE